MPKISVIMSVYNEAEHILRAAVDSVLAQTFGDFEYIIVLDNPQNERNKAVLREYAAKDARIKLHINERNRGLTFSLNYALGLAQGCYIARMDADDVSLPDRFAVQLDFIERNGLDFTGGYASTIDENANAIMSCVKVPVQHKKIVKALRYNNCIFHGTWFVKSRVYKEIQGYSGKYAEDYDLILRAMKGGFRFGNVPKVVLQYRLSSGSISRDNLFRQYLYMRFLQKKYFAGFAKPNLSADEYIEKYFSEKAAQKYSRAAALLSEALGELKRGRVFPFALKTAAAFCTSRFYTEKTLRYVLQYLL